jgi:hypothetical protein
LGRIIRLEVLRNSTVCLPETCVYAQ